MGYQFYIIPEKILKLIKTTITKFLIRLHNSLKIDVLQSPIKDFGLRISLQDIELQNIAAIGRNIPPTNTLRHITKTTIDNLNPEIQQKAAIKYIQTYKSEWKGNKFTKNLYKTLIAKDNLTTSLYQKFKQRKLGTKKKRRHPPHQLSNTSRKLPRLHTFSPNT